MPLRDHFRPPLTLRAGWAGFHHGWAFTIAQRLNGAVLTPEFRSEPEAHAGPNVSIDVATYEHNPGPSLFGENGNAGGVATAPATYTAPAPVLVGEAAFTDPDLFEVRVYRRFGGWQLVAAIELVSPANKDRDAHRRAFATKAASLLQQGVSVVVVDIVTDRPADLHAELREVLRLPEVFRWASPTGLSAIAYRVARENGRERLDVWPHPLAVGEPLPTLPLWLDPALAVPLELELTYTHACQSLRIE